MFNKTEKAALIGLGILALFVASVGSRAENKNNKNSPSTQK